MARVPILNVTQEDQYYTIHDIELHTYHALLQVLKKGIDTIREELHKETLEAGEPKVYQKPDGEKRILSGGFQGRTSNIQDLSLLLGHMTQAFEPRL